MCSEAAEGRVNWTMQMIADKIVLDGVVDSISDEADVYNETVNVSTDEISDNISGELYAAASEMSEQTQDIMPVVSMCQSN